MSKIVKLRSKPKGARFQPGVTRGLRTATVRARSFNPTTRTFTFVLASETPCRTYRIDRNWNYVEVDEVLPMAALEGLEGFRGCPLLDTHSSWSVRDVLGRITAMRVEGTELVCDAFLSDRDDVAGVASDIASGVLSDFSVGFDILEDGAATDRDGDVPLVTVRRWSVREGSLVPLPADSTATMRGARSRSSARPNLKPTGARAMTPEELKQLLTDTFAAATDTIVAALTDENEDEDAEAEAEAAAEAARAAVLAKRSGKPAGSKTTSTPAADASAIRGLREACKRNGRSAEFEALEKSGATVEELRGLLTASIRTSSTEIDGTSRPASGKRGGGLIRLEDTPAKRKAK